MSPALVIARYTVLEARRNRLAWLVLGFVVAGFGLSAFVGDVAIAESVRIRCGVYAALLRACSVFTVSLFVVTTMVRELDEKGLELVLSLPIPRASYFAGKLAGFSALAVLTAMLCAAALLAYAPVESACVWGVSLALELLIVTAMSVLALFTFTQATFAFGTVMAFYLLARSIAAFQLMAHGPLAFGHSLGERALRGGIDALAYLLPALDRFTRSEWVMDHTGGFATLGPIAAQSAIYLALLAGAALFDLHRKSL